MFVACSHFPRNRRDLIPFARLLSVHSSRYQLFACPETKDEQLRGMAYGAFCLPERLH